MKKDILIDDETLYTRIKYDIPPKVRDEIFSGAEDWLQEAPDDCMQAYVEMEYARRMLDENPCRFFPFKTKYGGATTSVDLKGKSVRNKILSYGGTEDDLRDAEELQKELEPLKSDLEYKRVFYNKVIAKNNTSREGKIGRFFGEHTETLIDLFGKLNPVEEIVKIMKADTGVELTKIEITTFYNANKAVIEKRKDEFLKSAGNYKISSDAGRLEILNSMLTDMLIKYKQALADNKDAISINYSKEIKGLLEQARKEIKGNELKLTVDGRIDISATLHGSENAGRILQTIPINSIVIGLVAAKVGLNPLTLVHQLATSYYSEFNGFNKNILGRDSISLPGDLVRTYDWGELEVKNKKFLNEMEPVRVEEPTYEMLHTDKEKRDSIMEKIRRLKSGKV